MTRRRQRLTEEQLAELQAAYNASDDGPTRTRYQAVRLYGMGYDLSEILEITGCSRSSLLEWWQRYHQTGLAGLIDQRAGGNRTKLTDEQRLDLKRRLHAYTPRQILGAQTASSSGAYWTIADLRQVVLRWYGVEYNQPQSYRRLLDECGFSSQRAAKVFRSHKERAIMEFQELLEKN